MTDFIPDWLSHPGDTVADLMEENGWTQKELSERMGMSQKHVSHIVRGRTRISPETAAALEMTVGGSIAFWLERDAQYEARKKEEEKLAALAKHRDWVRDYPMAWMANHGWVKRRTRTGPKVHEALKFLAVTSPDALHSSSLRAHFRTREFGTPEQRASALVWLRQAERLTTNRDVAAFDRQALIDIVPYLRTFTLEPDPAVLIPRLTTVCASVGVAVVLVPAPPGCPVHGAIRWSGPDKVTMALSGRYLTDDQLWFSFFHEVGHLVLHDKDDFTEWGERTPQEEEADRYAQTVLVPTEHEGELQKLGALESEVQAFARRIGVSPGIVVGRMQHDGLLEHGRLHHLKYRYKWANIRDE